MVDKKLDNGRASDAPLNGWRGIAAYLGRNQSTVKRWAASRDLPVHRPQGSQARKGVPVYAFASELDTWIKGHPHDLLEAADGPFEEIVAPTHGNTIMADHPVPTRRGLVVGVVAAAFAISAATGLAWRFAGPGAPGRSSEQVQDQARALHLEATYLWQKRTAETLEQAAGLLRRALEIEPRYSAAQADLAIVYNLMVEYEVIEPDLGYQMSRLAAEQAIALAPQNARAHSVLGDILFFWSRDYEGGLALLRKAAEYDPHDAMARHWLASALMVRGRYTEAAEEIRIARELEPMSRSIIVSQAMIALGQNQPEKAREALEQLVRNEPAYRSPYRFLAFAELATKNYPGYLLALKQRFTLTHDPAGLRVAEAGEDGWQTGGVDGMVQAMLAALRDGAVAPRDPYFIAHWLALAQVWPESAEQLARTPTRRFAYYGIDPAFTKARQDAGFRKKIMDSGLPVIW